MKILYLVRHAKSSWSDFSLKDFDRPLNERGKKNAPEMAERLKKKKAKIDIFISSPARRAKKTCKIFAKEFGYDVDDILYRDNIYEGSAENYFKVLANLTDKAEQVAIFGHNPGITEFANQLCEQVRIDNIPTCGIFAVEINCERWEDFRDAKKRFLFFDYPKMGQD